MRTVIYARFSSTLQNARSIEDQVALCRERCDREGWEVVDVFTDFAISGAAGIDEGARPGLNALLARVEATNHPGGRVEQVLADGVFFAGFIAEDAPDNAPTAAKPPKSSINGGGAA